MTNAHPARLRAILRALGRTIQALPHLGATFPLNAQEAMQAREKFIQEAALFLLIARRTASLVPGAIDDQLLEEILLGLSEAFDLQKFTDVIRAFPQGALAFGPLAAALDLFGQPDHVVPRTVREATKSRFYLAADRVPFRQLEALWLRNVIRGETHAFESMLPASILAMKTHPCFMRVGDAYAKTHCAMYFTDFGSRPRLDGADQEALKAGLDHDLAWTFARADWDLLGEILLAGRYCLDLLSPWHRVCEAALDAIFDKFGFVPTRTFNPQGMSSLARDGGDAYLLLHSYHTNVVYGLGLLNQLTRAKAFAADSGRPQASTDNPFRTLDAAGLSLDIVGSGFDPNWYDRSFDEFDLDSDFLNDAVLIRVFQDYGLEAALRFTRASPSLPPGPRTSETREVLLDHENLVKNMALEMSC